MLAGVLLVIGVVVLARSGRRVVGDTPRETVGAAR